MKNAIARSVLLVSAMFAINAGAQELNTLSKIRDQGFVILGVRESSAPLSYAMGDRYVGYHVEICERALQQLAPKAAIKYFPVTSQNRISLLQIGAIDIECGSTTNTAARKAQAGFVSTTFITEARFVVLTSSKISNEDDLAGKTINTLVGSAHVQRLRKLDKQYNVSLSKDHAESFIELDTGRADALILDDNLLAGHIATAKNPNKYRIIGKPMSRDPIAIMVRRNDWALKAALDGVIKKMVADGEIAQIYDKWFLKPIAPKNTVVNLPMSESLKAALANLNDDPAEAYESRP